MSRDETLWGRRARTRGVVAGLGLAALLSGALAACGPFGGATVPQQNCMAQQRGTLGPAGGVVAPLAARDPTDTAHNVSALYALDGADGKLAWSCVSTTYAGWSDVQQVGGVIYALAGTEPNHGGPATHAHAIYAIRPRDGKQLWEYSFMAGSVSTMLFDSGMLFTTTVTGGASPGPPGPPSHQVGSTSPAPQESLLAIHTNNGALAWSVHLANGSSEPVAVAGRIVFPFDSGGEWTLRAYMAATGAVAWSYRGPAGLAGLFAHGGMVYAVADRSLIALNGASGAARWTRTIPLPASGVYSAASAIQISANAFIVQVDQSLRAYDLATGALRWSVAAADDSMEWVMPDQRIYVVSYNPNNTFHSLTALDAATGATLWSLDVSKLQGLGVQLGAGGQLYLTEPTRAQLDETVVALNAHGREQWRHDGLSPYNSGQILLNGDSLYYIWQAPAATAGGNPADVTYVTSLRASDGMVRWQTALPGVNGDPVGPLVVA